MFTTVCSFWIFERNFALPFDAIFLILYRLPLAFYLLPAMDVVCLRPSAEARGGSANKQSPKVSFSTQQSDKLYVLLRQLQNVGGYSHTFGALDPVQVIQMGPHLSSIYVSGWQCSSTASTTNEPGPDFADYPMDTVPNKVDHLVRAQLHHDRRQQQERSLAILAGKNPGVKLDYLKPVIADGDTGHVSPCFRCFPIKTRVIRILF